MLERTTTKCSLIYGVRQGCLMGNTFDAGLGTDKAREAGMIGWWWSWVWGKQWRRTHSIFRKVLALYKDSKGTLKALVHLVEYKTTTNAEGPFGDSCLVRHYWMEFNQSNGKQRMYSVKVYSILHVIVAYEAIKYPQPLVPQVRCIHSHWEHTVMTVLPRKE
jgi:hypothetical protein